MDNFIHPAPVGIGTGAEVSVEHFYGSSYLALWFDTHVSTVPALTLECSSETKTQQELARERRREAKLLKAPCLKTKKLPFTYDSDAVIVTTNFEEGLLDPAATIGSTQHSSSEGALGLCGMED